MTSEARTCWSTLMRCFLISVIYRPTNWRTCIGVLHDHLSFILFQTSLNWNFSCDSKNLVKNTCAIVVSNSFSEICFFENTFLKIRDFGLFGFSRQHLFLCFASVKMFLRFVLLRRWKKFSEEILEIEL